MDADVLSVVFSAVSLLGDVPVLAEHAAQVAQPKEDRAGAVPATQAVLLAEVREGAGDDRVSARVAHARDVLEPVHVTVARTGAAVLELAQGGPDAPLELAAAVEREIGRFEVLEHEASLWLDRLVRRVPQFCSRLRGDGI